MGYKYDFDMFSVIPDEVQQKFQGMFNDLGISAGMTQQVALFRDPALVEALRGADEEVKNLLSDAGFGLNVYDSGAPQGRYPAYDEAARNTCLTKLTEGINKSENLKDWNWGGFSLPDFLEYIVTAEPIDQVDMPPAARASPEPAMQTPEQGTRASTLPRLIFMIGGAMVLVSIIGVVMGMMGN